MASITLILVQKIFVHFLRRLNHLVYWFSDVHKVVCLFFLGVFGFSSFFCRVTNIFSVYGKMQNFFTKAFTGIKKNHLSTKSQVKTRNFLKLFNMHWILSTMHPKWGTSPSLTFYFDIFGQKINFQKLLQPDRSCKPHKINRVTA